MIAADYGEIVQKLTEFGERQSDVAGVWVFGSQVRKIHPADRFSDLDILMLVSNPKKYIDSSDWVSRLGDVAVTFSMVTAADGTAERRVIFANGLDLDVVVYKTMDFKLLGLAAKLLKRFPGLWRFVPATEAQSIQDFFVMYRRGMRSLVDKQKIFQNLGALVPEQPMPKKPMGEEQALQLTNDFLYHTVWAAKKCARGDMWLSVDCINNILTKPLVALLEAQAQAIDPETDVWHEAHHIAEWSNQKAFRGATGKFAIYSQDSIKAALNSGLNALDVIWEDLVRFRGFKHPTKEMQFVRDCLAGLN